MAAAETAEAAVDAVLPDLHSHQPEREDDQMGNSTGSTMYMFGAVIVIYIVGMLLYQGFLWIKKKRDHKKDEEFRNDSEN